MESFNCENYEGCYYQYYYIKDKRDDYITDQILKFKSDKKIQMNCFAKIMGDVWSPYGFDYVIRVLGSNELRAQQGARIIPVAKAIAAATKARYVPNIVSKKRKTQPLKGLYKKHQREAELEGVYQVSRDIDLNGKNVLVVDDIATSGTSLTAIGRVLKEAFPMVNLYAFCIAHTKSNYYDGVERNKQEWEEEYKKVLAGN